MTRVLSLVPIRPVAAALLLAAGLFGPAGRADAACGDHVLIDGRPVAHEPTPPGEPCHGPNCSAREAPAPAPFAPPASPNPVPKDRTTDPAAPAAPAAGFDRVPDPPAGRPVRRPDLPFHPPRAA